jgi:multidrug efflux pump subunit AcrA (membrane-fusion protein)
MKNALTSVKNGLTKIWNGFWGVLGMFPFVSFIVIMALVVGILVFGVTLRKPEFPPTETEEVVTVATQSVGESPELVIQAKVDKAGVINIVALTPGVVKKIPVNVGQTVKDGATLVQIASNYQGGNTATVGRQIAQKNYQFLTDTFDAQKEVIAKNRELAQKAETLESELRAISRKSIDETKSLISLQEEINEGLDDQLELLESTNVGGINDGVILEVKGVKAQVLGGLNMQRSALRATEYTSSDSEEPADIARISRDATLKQLEIQEKSLQLNKDLAALNVKIARITEGMFFPSAPCGGVVERIHVKAGQQVNPGTVLVSLVTKNTDTTLVGLVPGDVAKRITPYGSARISQSDMQLTGDIVYVSKEPTEAGLHSIIVSLPKGLSGEVWQDQVVNMHVKLGASAVSDGSLPYVPIDAVYQTRTDAFVYVVKQDEDGKSRAEVRKVVLGEVFGSSVIVKEGLHKGDMVITSRNVADSSVVTFK